MTVTKSTVAWLTTSLRQEAEWAAKKEGVSKAEWLRSAAHDFVDRIEDRRYHPLLDPVYRGDDESESTSLATTAPVDTVRQWQKLADQLGWSLSQFLATAALLRLQRAQLEEALEEGE